MPHYYVKCDLTEWFETYLIGNLLHKYKAVSNLL